LLSEKNRKESQ